MTHPQRPLVGAGFAMTSLVLFVIMDATAKHLSARYPVPLLVWARYSVHLALMVAVLGPRLGRRLYATQCLPLHLLRGGLLVGTSLCGLAAFQRLPLAEATAVLFASPVIVVLMARPLLGERIGTLRACAVALGFAGVLLVARPGSGLGVEGVAFALTGALFYAAYQLLTRRMSRTEAPVTLLFHAALTGTAAMSIALPWMETGPQPTGVEYLLFLTMGCLAACSHFLLTKAFREAPASLLSPLLYVQLVWATLFGWLVFAQIPGPVALAGMAVIGVAGVLIAVDGRRSHGT